MAAGLVALAIAVAPGCARREVDAPVLGAPLFELRNAEGQTTFNVRRGPGGLGFHWADLTGHTEGDLTVGEGVFRGAGIEARAAGQGALDIKRPEGLALQLRRVDGTLRLGDAAGIPMARVRREGEAEAVATDAGGIIVARARSGGGRVVLSDREGKTVGYVTGDVNLERAALLLLPAISPAERAILLASP